MTYLVNQTNGTLLATVLDGAVDRTHAGLALIGKKVTNYGEIQNENYVALAENFSSSTSPVNPLEGQLWWNSSTNVLFVFDGNSWIPSSKITVPASAIGKTGDQQGMIAVDTTYLYACVKDYDGSSNIWTRTLLSSSW